MSVAEKSLPLKRSGSPRSSASVRDAIGESEVSYAGSPRSSEPRISSADRVSKSGRAAHSSAIRRISAARPDGRLRRVRSRRSRNAPITASVRPSPVADASSRASRSASGCLMLNAMSRFSFIVEKGVNGDERRASSDPVERHDAHATDLVLRSAMIRDGSARYSQGSTGASVAVSASVKRRERVKKRTPSPFSRENMPPRPGTTSMMSFVWRQYANWLSLM